MRTETKIVKIYEFSELDKEVQEKLIDNKIEEIHNVYLEVYLEDDMEWEAIELLNKYFKNQKPTFKRVLYDLSYVQGRGAMFEFDLYYYNKLVHIKNYGHYTHSRSFIISDDFQLTEKQEEQLKNKIIAMFEELEKIGDGLIEYVPSKDEAIEDLERYEYLSDGEVYDEILPF